MAKLCSNKIIQFLTDGDCKIVV